MGLWDYEENRDYKDSVSTWDYEEKLNEITRKGQ